MDVAAFSEDNFEVKKWINKTFKCAEAQENEAFLSSMVMKLQLYVQQVNAALEDTSQQVLHSLPRVMRDTEILHQEAKLLRDTMQSVKQEIAKVEKDTGQSMAVLERIDRIKTGLQTAEQALHEADNWTVLATDMEEVFESGDIDTIASKLVSMQQSLSILANVPDYDDKALQLEGLKNRLEALASPLLVQAFTSGSVEQSHVYVGIFLAIGRLPQLLKYYHKCQKGSLLQTWRDLVETEQDEGVAEWMSKFYDALLSNWHHQVKWLSQVFTSIPTLGTLIDLYSDVLLSLDPSFNECIDAALKQQSDQLTFLIELKQITKRFANNLDAAVENASHGREAKADLVIALAKAVYAPYIPYISQYHHYEQTAMSQQLVALCREKDDLMDMVQGLGQSIPRVITMTSDANTRCLQFTEGMAYCGLVKAINICLGEYLDKYRITLRKLDKLRGDGEDWNMFQMCLTLLQTVGVLIYELQQLDTILTQGLSDVWKNVESQEKALSDVWKNTQSREKALTGSGFKHFKVLLLTTKGQKEFDSLSHTVQEGEEMILIQPASASLTKICRDVHHTTFQAIFAPISSQLALVQSAPAWSSTAKLAVTSDLPAFSFAPQEYITQIGQYLMTLPQHLEPFLLQDNPALTRALKVADVEYGNVRGEGGFADVLLGIIARSTCQSYCENILGIMELMPSACKQLATDIDYLGNVLEDLGLRLSEHLQQVSSLLRLTPEEYQTKSSGCSARLVAAVRQMRNITSSA